MTGASNDVPHEPALDMDATGINEDLADVTSENLEEDGVLIWIDNEDEQSERTDISAAAEGEEEEQSKSSSSEKFPPGFNQDVMFMKFVPRMKQPLEITPLSLTTQGATPSLLDITKAGKNPGGYTGNFFKPKSVNGHFSHYELPTGMRVAPRRPDGSYGFDHQTGSGMERLTFHYIDETDLLK